MRLFRIHENDNDRLWRFVVKNDRAGGWSKIQGENHPQDDFLGKDSNQILMGLS